MKIDPNAKQVENVHFTDETVRVDDRTFVNCRFTLSRIVYTGGPVPQFVECVFDRCQWVFDGPAENTIQYFALMYTGLGLGGQEIVEGLFDSIRKGGVGHDILEHTPALR